MDPGAPDKDMDAACFDAIAASRIAGAARGDAGGEAAASPGVLPGDGANMIATFSRAARGTCIAMSGRDGNGDGASIGCNAKEAGAGMG